MIVYLHGFNSSGGKLGKAGEISKTLSDIDVFSPTYPSNDPDEAIEIVSDLVEEYKDDYDELMFVGCSMGGFFAQHLGRLHSGKIVLINPATEITKTLMRSVGENTNYNTNETYTLTTENVESFANYDVKNYRHPFGTLLLCDTGDDVIDYNIALNKYKDIAECHTFPGGDHRFAHLKEAMPLIERYYYGIWL